MGNELCRKHSAGGAGPHISADNRESIEKIMVALPYNHSGDGAKKCAYCAYELGIKEGYQRAVEYIEVGVRVLLRKQRFMGRRIELQDFISFVRTLKGELVYTLQRKRPFMVQVGRDELVYTPQSTNKARSHRFKRIQLYLEEYAIFGSFESRFYHGGANESYVLALIYRYVN